MKVEEKAKELVEKFDSMLNFTEYSKGDAKNCALIAVGEKINILSRIQEKLSHEEIKAVRLITKEVKELIKLRKAIESI